MSCACPSGPGRSITDAAKHAAWHALVLEQGGPADVVDVASLRQLRGTAMPATELKDPERVRAVYNEYRRTAIAVLVERERTWGPKK